MAVMCGRYRLSRRKQLVEEYFLAVSEEYEWSPRYSGNLSIKATLAPAPQSRSSLVVSSAESRGTLRSKHESPRNNSLESTRLLLLKSGNCRYKRVMDCCVLLS